jgi:hypothetical protein
VSTPDAVWSSAAKGAPGGFIFTVDIPPVDVPTNVYVYMGVCGNLATLNATLFSMHGSATGTFEYTMPAKTTGPYFIATLTIPPAKKPAGKRTLSGWWGDSPSGHAHEQPINTSQSCIESSFTRVIE